MKQQTESSQRSFFRIYRQALANSAGVMLAYRSNLIFFFLFESFFLTSSFLGAGLGVSLAGGSINGWSRDQIFALTALNGVSHQFFVCFFIAPLFNLPEYVWNGRMDYILQKPLHPLLALIATSEIMISNLPNFVINLALAVYFILKIAPSSGPSVWMAFGLLGILGIAVRFALAIFCMAPAFFAERLVEGEDVPPSVRVKALHLAAQLSGMFKRPDRDATPSPVLIEAELLERLEAFGVKKPC